MKKLIKLYLLLTLTMVPIALAHAQDAVVSPDVRSAIYADPKVIEAIDFLKDRLPNWWRRTSPRPLTNICSITKV